MKRSKRGRRVRTPSPTDRMMDATMTELERRVLRVEVTLAAHAAAHEMERRRRGLRS